MAKERREFAPWAQGSASPNRQARQRYVVLYIPVCACGKKSGDGSLRLRAQGSASPNRQARQKYVVLYIPVCACGSIVSRSKKEKPRKISEVLFWSERRESNPRESAWEADAIPLGDSRKFSFVQYLLYYIRADFAIDFGQETKDFHSFIGNLRLRRDGEKRRCFRSRISAAQ